MAMQSFRRALDVDGKEYNTFILKFTEDTLVHEIKDKLTEIRERFIKAGYRPMEVDSNCLISRKLLSKDIIMLSSLEFIRKEITIDFCNGNKITPKMFEILADLAMTNL